MDSGSTGASTYDQASVQVTILVTFLRSSEAGLNCSFNAENPESAKPSGLKKIIGSSKKS